MGKVLKPILGIALTAVGFVTGNAALIMAGISMTTSGVNRLLSPSAGRPGLTPFDPRAIAVDAAARRKMVLGRTALPMDMVYAEPSGTNQEFIDYIFALAGHRSDAIESIHIEEDLAWTVAGGVQGKYVGYLTIETRLEAGAAAFHTVNGGATWNSTRRLTGCTTMRVRVRRSNISESNQSPFGSGISGRWTVTGRGMPVYDPAADSTQPGGSGTQRANNNSTWAYTVSSVARGNNPALQLLAFLLGWRIGGELSVGCGLPVDSIDIASFAAAAAICDESVALAGGGSQRRFESGMAFSDDDDPMAVIGVLLEAMAGELVDDGGRLALRIAVNDLTPAITLTDDDFISGYQWQPQPDQSQQYTTVRGRFTSPDTLPPFSMVDYPEVAVPRTSLVPRAMTLELRAVQDQRRAERLAKQAAGRSLYPGTFRVTLGPRGWQLRRNMVVAITSSARGWTAKLLRVRELRFVIVGESLAVEATFREENSAIYPPAGADTAVVMPVAPVVFDSRTAASWLQAGIEAGADVTRATVPVLSRLDWASGITYQEGDIAFRNNVSYAATVDHVSSSGNAPPSANWRQMTPGPDDSYVQVEVGEGVFNTSYGTTPVASFSARTKTAGQVQLSLVAEIRASGTNAADIQAAVKWQRDTGGGTWVDVASETVSALVAPGGTGTYGFSINATGLATNTLVPFRLLARIIRTGGSDDYGLYGATEGRGT